MKKIGFGSTKIVDDFSGEIIGLCDFKLEDTVYLSLFMIDGKLQSKGLCGEIYRAFEQMFKRENAHFVRIDVVDNYSGNSLAFWKKQGFESQGRTELVWKGKLSEALIMKKTI